MIIKRRCLVVLVPRGKVTGLGRTQWFLLEFYWGGGKGARPWGEAAEQSREETEIERKLREREWRSGFLKVGT